MKPLYLVLVLAYAAPCAAEPLKIPAADLWTTHQALASGRGAEGNPVMAGSDAKRIVIKAVITTVVLYAAAKLETRHPRTGRVLLYTLSGVVGAVAVRNARN